MKLQLTLAAGLALSTTLAHAGGMAPAIMPEAQIVEEAKSSSSSAGIIVPLIIIALVALAMSKSTSSTGGEVIVSASPT